MTERLQEALQDLYEADHEISKGRPGSARRYVINARTALEAELGEDDE